MAAVPKLCDDQTLRDLVSAIQSGTKDEIERADRLIVEYPEDGRLHFLRGSLLAGIGRSIEALSAFRKAVELAPDMAIARFQLGFFLLTSGAAAEALSVWGPLVLLPDTHYLRLFVGGLTHLVRDEFADAIRLLEEGIAANQENPALSGDMSLIIQQIGSIPTRAGPGDTDEEISATTMLLGQLAPRRTTH